MHFLFILILAVVGNTASAAGKSFAQFRPKTMDLDFLEKVNKGPSSKTTIEEIFGPSLTKSVENQYKSAVAPSEKLLRSPYHFARPWEVEDYYVRNREMAEWTTKEALNAHLYSMFHRADQDSAGMQIANTFREITGGESTAKKASSRESVVSAGTTAKKDEVIPTKLKTKMNVIKGSGNLVFQNPIVTPSVNLNVGKHSDEHVTVDLSKNFQDITLQSKVRYGVDKKAWLLDMNKKITDQIYCNISSLRYTGDSSATPSGAKNDDRVSMTYSVGF